MTNFTDEQKAFIAAFGDGNIAGDAVAGSGKTATLEESLRQKASNALYTVFNKRNADEAKKRLEGKADIATLNGLGHRAWAKHLGKSLNLNADKMRDLFGEAFRGIAWSDRRELLKEAGEAARSFKGGVFMPPDPNLVRGSALHPLEAFTDLMETEWPSLFPYREKFYAVMADSVRLALAGKIDFDDQIYMPCLYNASPPWYNQVCVDEGQDLNAAQRKLVSMAVRPNMGKVAVIGDPRQAIYAWRGADSNSFDLLKESFACKTFQLTYCFRCPSEVIRLARASVPYIKSYPGAPAGQVNFFTDPETFTFNHGSMVICRNNAPLLSLGFRLIREGIGPFFLGGRDIKTSLLRVVNSLNMTSRDLEDYRTALRAHYEDEIAKYIIKQRPIDKLVEMRETLMVIINNVQASCGGRVANIEDFTQALDKMFDAESGPVTLGTPFRAKGLEWDEVTIIDPQLMKLGGQEDNVWYVAVTRAKKTLNYHLHEDDMRGDDIEDFRTGRLK